MLKYFDKALTNDVGFNKSDRKFVSVGEIEQ